LGFLPGKERGGEGKRSKPQRCLQGGGRRPQASPPSWLAQPARDFSRFESPHPAPSHAADQATSSRRNTSLAGQGAPGGTTNLQIWGADGQPGHPRRHPPSPRRPHGQGEDPHTARAARRLASAATPPEAAASASGVLRGARSDEILAATFLNGRTASRRSPPVAARGGELGRRGGGARV